MADFDAIAQVFAQTDRELWLLTAEAEGRRGGLIATFVSQASIVPHLPRVVVGLAKQHHTTPLVAASRACVLHLLGTEQRDWAWHFGLRSGRDVDKFAGLSYEATSGGPRLTGALGWLACRVEAALDVGDRMVFVAEVVEGRLERPGTPLTLRGLLQAASPEQLRALKEGMLRDAAIDAAAIETWRSAHT